ncbi:MAG: signal recognition particle receptor subunit alpha [Promethearchaeota archaeon]
MPLSTLGKSLKTIISKIKGASIVDEKLVKELVADLQRSLIQADVNIELILQMTEEVKNKALTEKLPPGISRRELTIKAIYDELTRLLGKKHEPLHIDPAKPNVFMFIGIQGSGKTTSLAKLALFLKKRGHKVGVICGDTFRPGALAQLEQLLTPHDIELFGDSKEKSATKVVVRGLKHFSQKNTNVILIDTSGRHKEEKGLLNEMRVLAAKSTPKEVILVIDGTIGQQAGIQASAFNQATNVGSIILTKLDGSAKGGGAISAVATTAAKIRYIGMGEKIEDIELFDPTRYLERVLGIPNLQNILDTIKEIMPGDADLMQDMKKGIKLRHLKIQMEQMTQGGKFTQLLRNIIPGGGQDLPPGFEMQSKENAQKFLAICRAMTREELNSENPKKFLNSSRRKRIARGAGVRVEDVNALLKQYTQTQSYIKRLMKSRGRGKGLGALGGMGPLGPMD